MRVLPEIDEGPVETFLLMGQSNMAGRGEIEPGDDEAAPGVFVLGGQCLLNDSSPVEPLTWSAAKHPVHLDQEPKNQFGLALDFARRYRELTPGITVGLIPCAWGGQSIDALGPGTPVYENAIARARIAAGVGSVAGVLWHQGESDTRSTSSAQTYGAKLHDLITHVRSDIDEDLMFVIGDIAQTLGAHRDDEGRGNAERVRSQLHAIATGTRRCGWVSSRSLHTATDDIHFTRAALRTFGRRFAEKANEINHEG